MTSAPNRSRKAALLLVLLLAAGCAELPKGQEKPAPVSPQITEETLRSRAREQLALGVKQYEVGEFEAALKSLSAALDHGLLSKQEQSRARKYLAFVHCVSAREAQCRDEFRKAFEINPEFALSSAEDGHPIWGPVYRDVRTQLISEREAAVKKPLIPLAKAEQLLSDGIVKYDAGEFAASQKLLEAALKEGLKEKADTVRAMKHLAFTLCLQERYAPCRAEFARIYEVDPAFDLTPAEAGHPSWTKTFTAVKRAHEAKVAKEAKDKAPAAATPPKKN